MKINLNISNPKYDTYKYIMFRKFFQMVFIGEDGMTLHIYTATAISGSKVSPESSADGSDGITEFYPLYDRESCAVKFKYESSSIKSAESTNLTSSFFKQPNRIQEIWGNCNKIETQEKANNILHNYYKSNIKVTPNFNISSTGNALYAVEEKKHGNLFSCILDEGSFEKNDEEFRYTLSQKDGRIQNGIEFTNWVKTTITLNESILNSEVQFSITFNKNNTTFYAPDFTWYFAPPITYEVDTDTAIASFGETKNAPNKVASVGNNTTVNFDEWSKDEDINSRKKCHVLFSKNANLIIMSNVISVSVQIGNAARHGNKQFFLGLLVAFILSFCTDQTRISYIQNLLYPSNFYPQGESTCDSLLWIIFTIVFPISVITSFILYIIPPKDKGIFKFWRISGIIITALLFVYIYILIYCSIIPISIFLAYSALDKVFFIVASMNMVFNIIYIIYNCSKRKISILDFL